MLLNSIHVTSSITHFSWKKNLKLERGMFYLIIESELLNLPRSSILELLMDWPTCKQTLAWLVAQNYLQCSINVQKIVNVYSHGTCNGTQSNWIWKFWLWKLTTTLQRRHVKACAGRRLGCFGVWVCWSMKSHISNHYCVVRRDQVVRRD